jgi:alpha-beta hydrolase superfamily lysophospholipase
VAEPLDVSFEVPAARVAASLFLPCREEIGRSVVVGFHGGGYTRSYFHVDVPGRDGYSMAEHLTRHGHVVVTVDQFGVGDSTRPADGAYVTVDAVADVHHATCSALRESLAAGTLAADLPPIAAASLTGIGHSIGGSLLVVQQARHGSFDRIAVLGTTLLPREWGGEFAFDVESGYAVFDRSALRSGFYWDDVPDDVIEADARHETTMPVGVVPASDVAAAEAAAVRVPVFVGFGERDVSPDPRSEIALYTGSTDLTLHILSRSGHCSNFASGRRALWNRIAGWIDDTPADDR